MKCIVHNCSNTTDKGKFVGDLCFPCHQMLTTGQLSYGDSFLGELRREFEKLKLHVSYVPKDRDGLPINPALTYKTTDGVRCKAKFIVDFDVTVTQNNYFRTCTTHDVSRWENG